MEFICSSTEPIVQTKAGKIRGFRLNGTYTFQGIQYATAKRFHMPVPVEPWEGVKDALNYGYICPLMSMDIPYDENHIPHRFWPQSEDCLYLNVWSRQLDTAAKKPVMVWIHGGAFNSGSSVEQLAYEGGALAENGDVVVVSLNHRLNILGYLDVSAYGEEYKDSGCAGIADLVEALKWVRDNIAQFGGDPDNVTVFGQSGGGGKIQVLLQTPAAHGLFHKAIIQSGIINFTAKPSPEGHKKMVAAMLGYLGTDDIAKLEEVSYETLVEAYNAVSPSLKAEGYDVGWAPMPGGYYLGDAREIGFCDFAKSIPCIVGSNIGEFSRVKYPPKKNEMSEDERREVIVGRYGDAADAIIEEYRKAYPGRNIVDLLSLDTSFRVPNYDFLDKRSAISDAPMYVYLFALDFPIDDGTPAWHGAEIPYAFHNINMIPVCGIPGVSERLQDQIFGAWTAFAHTGNPNNAALPEWIPYNNGCNTMVIDRECVLKQDFDRELVKLVDKAAPPTRRV